MIIDFVKGSNTNRNIILIIRHGDNRPENSAVIMAGFIVLL